MQFFLAEHQSFGIFDYMGDCRTRLVVEDAHLAKPIAILEFGDKFPASEGLWR